MSISQRNDAACCRINGVGAATFQANDGFNTPARSAAGTYTVKTDKTYDPLACLVQCNVIGGAANANAQITTANGVDWSIVTSVAAVATDEIFYILIEPIFIP
jgi:hypothetical protein